MENQKNPSNENSTLVTGCDSIPAFALPPIVLRFKDQDDNKELVSDGEYFEALLACECMRLISFRFRSMMSENLLQGSSGLMFGDPESKPFESATRLCCRLTDLVTELDLKREKKYTAMSREPLVEKFLGKIGATIVQRRIFRYIFVSVTGMLPNNRHQMKHNRPHCVSIPSACFTHAHDIFQTEISLGQLMGLADIDSIWVKEQIYNRAKYPSSVMSCMGSDTIRALMGLQLTLTQYLAIESTLLQETLKTDKLFQTSDAGIALLRKQGKRENIASKKVNLGYHKSDDLATKNKNKHVLDKQSDVKTLLNDSLRPPRSIKDNNTTVVCKINNSQKIDQSLPEITDLENSFRPSATGSKRERIFNVLSNAVTTQKDNLLSGGIQRDVKKEKDSLEGDPEEEKFIKEFGPYSSDLTYLEDQIRLTRKENDFRKLRYELENDNIEDDGPLIGNTTRAYHDMMGLRQPSNNMEDVKINKERKAKKLEIQLIKLRDRIQTRLSATKSSRSHVPRLEQLCATLNLEKFEKFVVLDMVAKVICPNQKPLDTYTMARENITIGDFITSFSNSLEENMRCRHYFYKSSTLVKEGIITISNQDFMTDLTSCTVQLDRRMFDYIVGLDTEFSEIVDGSHLYVPNVNLDDVVLPSSVKSRICDTVLNFDLVKEAFNHFEVDQKITYGIGQVLLFYGSSGTGKTMLANAIATKIEKKVLLVNFPTLGLNQSGKVIKFLFREARINNALLFFDECESLFMSREKGGGAVNMLLTELERFEDLCILATNRPCDLDEAMTRRITVAVEIQKPDLHLREEIWKKLHPLKIPLSDDIDFNALARRFELTGGLIKNAWLQAVGMMVHRTGEKLTQEDLMQAANEQAIGRLALTEDFDRRVVPTQGIEAMVLDKNAKEVLTAIVQNTKAKNVLFGQWGFDKLHRPSAGISALFTGKPGTGKTMAAESIGFNIGKPIKMVNLAQLVSKYVGETGKNIETVFDDAKAKDAVLVFDEAESLFGTRQSEGTSVGRHDSMHVGLLLQYIENFEGICIAITNQKSAIDNAFFRRFNYVLEFKEPTIDQRERLWKQIIPKKCPLATDTSDLRPLAQKFDLCGGSIKSALFRAATKAALQLKANDRVVTMRDLEESCAEELKKADNFKTATNMYS